MKRSIVSLIVLFALQSGFAQIHGLSLSARYSKTEVGRTSAFGPASNEYSKIHPDIFLVGERIDQNGFFRWHANPYLFGYTPIFNNEPPGTIRPSLPKNGNFVAIDFTVMDIDHTGSIIGKGSFFSIGLGYRFIWKVEGMRLDHFSDPYMGMTQSGPRFDGDYSYGSGRFAPVARLGIGPTIDMRLFPDSDKFGFRAAVGAGFYGGERGTYRTVQSMAYFAATDWLVIKLGYEKMTKLFSNELEGFSDQMQARLGEDLKVTTTDISFGVILQGDFGFMNWAFGGRER